jgi:hypothetical protein
MKTKLNQTLEKMVDAVAFYHDTGKHRQVKFRYDPLVRTEFDFKGWKHEKDADAVRSILPEDIMVDIKSLFKNKKEHISWEKMVNIYETIQIDNVSEGLRIISEKYKLTRQEELNILAYVKFLEMMVKKIDMVNDITNSSSNDYDGSMFG